MKQNDTPEKKIVRRNQKRILIYEMLFEGRNFKEIAEASGFSDTHLRRCLGPSGKWYADYMEWATDKTDAIEKDVRLRIKKRMNEAMVVLEYALTIAKSDPRTAVKAARDLLDRGGLKAPEKVEITSPYDQAEKLAQWMENKNKPKQPTDE